MSQKKKYISPSGMIMVALIFINAIILKIAFVTNPAFYRPILFTMPLLLLAIVYFLKERAHLLYHDKEKF
jgi:Mn2+/Fe2+ NRAMP family transporter